MTTRYRVEYALKTHRRDQFIEWIKGLLAVPFVLLSQPNSIHQHGSDLQDMQIDARTRYIQIMRDVEKLVADHIKHQLDDTIGLSKLKLLVPSVGSFFTPLPLQDAFIWQDNLRAISSRRFVAPSFNDVRLILNSAQAISLVRYGSLELVTFDGDVTLYPDGYSLEPDNPCIPRILDLLNRGTCVGIVTAAGYTEAEKYYERLYGLLDAVTNSEIASKTEHKLVVMGGEANFLFTYNPRSPHRLEAVPKQDWQLAGMQEWTDERVNALLDVAEKALQGCIQTLKIPVQVLRKPKAVGIYPAKNIKLPREQLEETVLVVQRTLELSEAGRAIPFCVFNGGNDVFVDIGDKSLGVLACQGYFGGIAGSRSLHVGDQFLSVGANDFKARLATCTAWIASPAETVDLLDEITAHRSRESPAP